MMDLSPDYIHLLINHFPVIGLFLGWLLLLMAFLLKQKPVVGAAFGMIALCAGMAFPVAMSGERAADVMHHELNSAGKKWLAVHEEHAEDLSKACYALAILSIAGWMVRRFQPKAETAVVWITIVLTAAVLAGNIWVADAGGKIRHSEFRKHGGAP